MATIKEVLKNDIDKSFEKLVREASLSNDKEVIAKAKNQLTEELEGSLPDNVKKGLNNGFDLIQLIKASNKSFSKKIGIAALEYLIDPWDIIPDFISDDGFLDDIYVINRAIEWIKEEESKTEVEPRDSDTDRVDKHWIIFKVGGATGPHLAKRAKELDILNSFQRKALFDIGRKHLYGYELTSKQHSFFESLVEDIVQEGILEYDCPDSPCKYCEELNSIFNS